MTLEQAVEILNRYHHHDHSRWHISGEAGDEVVFGGDHYEVFTAFEAVALAEKIENELPWVCPQCGKESNGSWQRIGSGPMLHFDCVKAYEATGRSISEPYEPSPPDRS
ncbi:MAG: hypothetical protein NVSMB14_17170 [Isosphaeraceae bacterium]